MANDTGKIVLRSLDGGPSIMVQSAKSFQLYTCGLDGCGTGHAHVVLLDADGNPICESTFARDQLLRIAETLR